jgi:hypothetical protein
MEDGEVERIVGNVWGMTREGRNSIGQPDLFCLDVEHLKMDSDAFKLLAFLQAHQGPHALFWCTNTLAERNEFNWGPRRLADARRVLIEQGYLMPVRQAGPGHPALFKWGRSETRIVRGIDETDAEREVERKARKLERDRKRRASASAADKAKETERGRCRRAAEGSRSHAESLGRTRPWEAAGVSRRTWERHRDANSSAPVRDANSSALTTNTYIPLSPVSPCLQGCMTVKPQPRAVSMIFDVDDTLWVPMGMVFGEGEAGLTAH